MKSIEQLMKDQERNLKWLEQYVKSMKEQKESKRG